MTSAPAHLSANFANTWYADTAVAASDCHRIEDIDGLYDVAVIGAGLAGLSAAFHLAQSGARVILIEKYNIGDAASGRNGGFCTNGWASSAPAIEKLLRPDNAAALDALASEGLEWMRARCFSQSYSACQPVNGCLTLSLFADDPLPITQSKLGDFIKGPRYKSGSVDHEGFHFHPLNFLRCLAADCLEAGVTILQNCPVLHMKRDKNTRTLITVGPNKNEIAAKTTVITTGGTGGMQFKKLSKLLVPVQTFIAVSAPMPEILTQHIPTPYAIADTRRAGNYFRKLPDGRLLWGMGISALAAPNSAYVRRLALQDIAAHLPEMAKEMAAAKIGLDYAWSGTMGYARHFMPYVGPLGRNSFCAAGFGGHGMNTAPIAGKLIAEVISGNDNRLAPFHAVPKQQTYGTLGKTAAEAYYRMIQGKDRLKEFLA
ncbi:MAG: NAD(P)/FAD-dependent oxidoreductase [Paracoccaceae bacterium]